MQIKQRAEWLNWMTHYSKVRGCRRPSECRPPTHITHKDSQLFLHINTPAEIYCLACTEGEKWWKTRIFNETWVNEMSELDKALRKCFRMQPKIQALQLQREIVNLKWQQKKDNFCLIGNTITTLWHLKKRQIDKLSSISTAKQVYFKNRKMVQKSSSSAWRM